MRPPSPLQLEVHRAIRRLQALLGEAQQRPHDLDERDVVAGLARQRLVDQRDGADAAHRLRDRRLGLRVLQPTGLQAQQRRDRLQVVLHPVVDLADRGVLADQQAVALAQVGDVAHQQHAAGDLAVGEDRQAAAQQRDVGRRLELLDDRDLLLVRLAHHVVVEAELGQRMPTRWRGCRRGAAPSWRSARGSVTRPSASRLITPSPTRGAAVESAPRAGYGNEPSAIIPAKRSKIDT